MLLLSTSITGCSNWIFRIDVPQGNFVDQEDVDKLRIGMTKEQVIYVLGKPVMRDTFDDDIFYYFYTMKAGSITKEDYKKEFYVYFEDDRLTRIEGDYTPSDDFNIPLDQ